MKINLSALRVWKVTCIVVARVSPELITFLQTLDILTKISPLFLLDLYRLRIQFSNPKLLNVELSRNEREVAQRSVVKCKRSGMAQVRTSASPEECSLTPTLTSKILC